MPAGTTLAAEIVGRDSEGRPWLRSGEITLRLETPLEVPLGARLALTLPQGLSPPSEPAAKPLQRLPAADHALGARLLRLGSRR